MVISTVSLSKIYSTCLCIWQIISPPLHSIGIVNIWMFFLNYLNSTEPRQRRTWVSRVKASFSGWMARQDHSHSTTVTIFLYSWYSPPGHLQCLDFRALDWSKEARTTKWGWREMRKTQETTEEKWIYSLGFNEF